MMKGQLSIESVLVVFLAIAAASAVFLFMRNIVVSSQASAEKALVYPEEPPQILSIRCYLNYGYVTVQSDSLQGTINYQISHTNGSVVKTSTLSANITDAGKLSFGALMTRGSIYSLRLYTPKWSVSDTCTARVHDDVVLYLPMDEASGTTTSDQSGYENNGVIYGATLASGKRANAMNFSGVSDHINVSDDSSLDITKELTLSLWIKTKWVPPDYTSIVLSKSRDTSYVGAYWLEYSPSGNIQLYLSLKNNGDQQVQGSVINDGNWHYVAGTYNGSAMKIYVDNQIATKFVSDTMRKTSGNLTIGKGFGISFGKHYFNGTIDEVRIYDRALSADEVSAVYQAYQ